MAVSSVLVIISFTRSLILLRKVIAIKHANSGHLNKKVICFNIATYVCLLLIQIQSFITLQTYDTLRIVTDCLKWTLYLVIESTSFYVLW